MKVIQMSIKDMSIDQLKVLAYDLFAMTQNHQDQLRQVNDMIVAKTVEAKNGQGQAGGEIESPKQEPKKRKKNPKK